jgi:hypothetical protein
MKLSLDTDPSGYLQATQIVQVKKGFSFSINFSLVLLFDIKPLFRSKRGLV